MSYPWKQWHEKTVLIIGGTGYIGSALYPYLSQCKDYDDYMATGAIYPKYIVDTVDLEWFGNQINGRNYKQDYRTLTKEFVARYDVVILLAGYSSPAICTNSGDAAVYQNNVVNFATLLPKLSDHQKFIYASTIAIYQGGRQEELTEDHPLIITPSNSYEFSKWECDRLVQMYPNIEYYGLRLATLSGVSDNWRSDLMVNAMTDTGLNQGEVRVFNPENRKPILYLQDLCKAVEAIIECPKDKRGFYNLASYNGITEQIAEVVADLTDSKLTVLGNTAMKQAGLPNTSYDFAISSRKFEQEFNFKFAGSTEQITKEITDKINNIHHGKRIDGIEYKI
jgi:nucleoside-diphosphate-sugar epimerase